MTASPKKQDFSEQEIEDLFISAISNVDEIISSFQKTINKQSRIKFKESLDKYISVVFQGEQRIEDLQCSAFIGANLMWYLLNDKN